MNENKVFKIIGSKWFIFFLGIGLCIALITTTYPNLIIVYNAQMMGKLWYIPTVFTINILGIFMCVMKFLDKQKKDKSKSQEQEWE